MSCVDPLRVPACVCACVPCTASLLATKALLPARLPDSTPGACPTTRCWLGAARYFVGSLCDRTKGFKCLSSVPRGWAALLSTAPSKLSRPVAPTRGNTAAQCLGSGAQHRCCNSARPPGPRGAAHVSRPRLMARPSGGALTQRALCALLLRATQGAMHSAPRSPLFPSLSRAMARVVRMKRSARRGLCQSGCAGVHVA